MRRHSHLRAAPFTTTSLIVVSLAATAGAQSIAVPIPGAAPDTTRYAAKILCGVQADPHALHLVRGAYATIVNLLNIGDASASVSGSLALARPPVPPQPGETFDLPEITLAAGEAAAIDCDDLRATVFPFGLPASHIDGFVTIESTTPLSVSAVYTAAPLIDKDCCKSVAGPVASVDVEQVAPLAVAPDTAPQPDLVPQEPAPESDPPGNPGTGFCSQSRPGMPPDAVADIRNIGVADAAASSAEFDFGPFGTAQVAVGPLSPGQSQQVTVPIPVQCFGTGAAQSCEFDVTADAAGQVAESLETNNMRHGQCRRAREG